MAQFYTDRFTTNDQSEVFDDFSKAAFKSLAAKLEITILYDKELKRTGQDFICDGSMVPSYLADTVIDGLLLVESTSRKKQSYDRFVSKDMPNDYFELPLKYLINSVLCNIPKRRYEIWNKETYLWHPIDAYSIYVEFPYPEGLNSTNINDAVLAWERSGSHATIWKYKDIIMIKSRDGEGTTYSGDSCVKMPLEYRFRLKDGLIVPEKFPLDYQSLSTTL